MIALALLGWLVITLVDSTPDDMTQGEWLTIGVVLFVGVTLKAAIENRIDAVLKTLLKEGR
jgi:hypothetical protein